MEDGSDLVKTTFCFHLEDKDGLWSHWIHEGLREVHEGSGSL
jgi:hypothetical protein